MVALGTLVGVCPAYGLTTRYYLVRKHASKPDAEEAMAQVLRPFQLGNLEAMDWPRVRGLPVADFADAVVATVARATASALIITRKVEDFAGAPVPATTPADCLSQMTTAV